MQIYLLFFVLPLLLMARAPLIWQVPTVLFLGHKQRSCRL